MTFTFRPAARENVNLLIGLAGSSGSGKTYTGMRLASGMAAGRRFAVIDTENGRASHYADQFKFDVAELHAPFSPAAYTEAILAADAAGYPVIMVDSMSHEYAGEGGVLDMQEAEYERMGSRDSAKVASWIKPKGEHKKMVSRLLQVRANLILCFRAEPKIEVAKEGGKTVIVPKKSLVGLDGWIPVTEKNLPFELTVSFLFTADAPGIPKPIKLQQQHRALFPLDKPITEEAGRAIAAWAAGGATPAAPQQREEERADTIGEEQVQEIGRLCRERAFPVERVLKQAQIDRLEDLLVADYGDCVAWIKRKPIIGAPDMPDEAQALLKIDAAKNIDEANAIVDLCSTAPYAKRLAAAVQQRFQ